jgi:hypothetical protein
LPFLIKKYIKKLPAVNFFNFWSSKPWIWNWIWIPGTHWDLDPKRQFKKMLDPPHHNPGGGGINNAAAQISVRV